MKYLESIVHVKNTFVLKNCPNDLRDVVGGHRYGIKPKLVYDKTSGVAKSIICYILKKTENALACSKKKKSQLKCMMTEVFPWLRKIISHVIKSRTL